MSAYTEKAREIADKVFEASRNTSGSYEDFREDAAPIIAAAIEAAVAEEREACAKGEV